jgi:hypothetical protein
VVVAGFATHPDWDHVLWDAALGDAPRFGTARCAAVMVVSVRGLLGLGQAGPEDPDELLGRRRTAHLGVASIADLLPAIDDLDARVAAGKLPSRAR